MKIIYKMAFRNIFRRKGRSTLLITIVTVAVFAASFVVALVNGWAKGVFMEYIDMQTSHLQIHTKGFSTSNDISGFMDRRVIQATLSGIKEVDYVSYRLKTNALVSTAQTSSGLTLIGVDKEEEIMVSSIYKSIESGDGSYFDNDILRPIIISKRTAEKLNVNLRSKIIVSFQDSSGEIQKVLFRVGGFFQTHTKSFDNMTAFVQFSDLMPYLNLPDVAVHEVALVLNDLEECDDVKQKITQLLPDYEVKKWNEVLPLLQLISAWHRLASFLFLVLFFIALGLSTSNFMMMSVVERKGEFRMLNKVGMSGSRIASMIIIETLFTTFIATFLGLALSVIAVSISSQSGIDFTFLFDNQSGYGFGTIVYPAIDIRDFVYIFVLMTAISVIVTISPIKKVLK
ncbi:MAG: ABC transporter permease [Bacteroidales bacterium]|nr:ABC transporter permease [Bacteroidales bacterium]